MAENNQPKRMTGALLSGVIYLDEQGAIQEVHWCVTPDGESAPVDVQPVIRLGSLEEANILLPEMLADLTERFAKAAAVEAAKAAKSKKKATNTTKVAIPQTGAAAAEKQTEKDTTQEQESDEDTSEEAVEMPKELEASEPEEEQIASTEESEEPQKAAPERLTARPDGKKSSKTKQQPAMNSLFDGLDLS